MTKEERIEKQKIMLEEMSAREKELHLDGYKYIAGIDEVGRGPLAGPVYAAVVVLPDGFDVLGINDSKKVSQKKREELSEIIKEESIAYGIGIADNNEIDEINILEATKNAMLRAIDDCNEKLKSKGGQIEYLLIDAVKLDTDIKQESFVKGDERCLCIAAASIVAKVTRDSYMVKIDEKYPGYDFASNKGYGTAAHYKGLRELGFSEIHRRSFLKKFEEEQSGERKAAWSNTTSKGEKMAKKVYAVKNGRETGLFMDWESCKKQVDGFPNAEYKSFADPNEALVYLGLAGEKSVENEQISGYKAYVDGSFDEASNNFSCGVVIIDEEGQVQEMKKSFFDEDASAHRNVAGEVMGSKMAIQYCLDKGIKELTVFHDYEGIAKWANDEWKANHKLTQEYKSFVKDARDSMKITFVKVKAHAGNKYNELADKLAKEALGIK